MSNGGDSEVPTLTTAAWATIGRAGALLWLGISLPDRAACRLRGLQAQAGGQDGEQARAIAERRPRAGSGFDPYTKPAKY